MNGLDREDRIILLHGVVNHVKASPTCLNEWFPNSVGQASTEPTLGQANKRSLWVNMASCILPWQH